MCRVVYVPGPLDPVIPSIRLPHRGIGTAGLADRGPLKQPMPSAAGGRQSRGRGGAAEGAAVQGVSGDRDRILQLTPTSKNLYR